MLCAITFDFWGTLYQNAFARQERMALVGEVLAQAGQPRSPEQLDAAYRHAWQVFDHIWRNEHRSITVEGWVEAVLSFLEADLAAEVRAELYRPIQEILLHVDPPPMPVPGVAGLLPRLEQRYRLGLISDVGLTPGRVLRELMRRDGLLPCFRTLTFSDETGMTKPLPAVFLRTLEELEAQAEHAVHIGDLPETDIAGAKGVGMKAILFLGVSWREDGRELADAAIETYDEFEEVLGDLAA